MFDKMLSKIGIGAAKVQTTLHETEVMRGEVITGEVKMVGGKVAQDVRQVYIELQTHYIEERPDGLSTHTHTLHRLEIADAFTLNAGEEVIYDFELQIPLETPISFGNTTSWIHTGLDVAWAFDPSDNDTVQILPDPGCDMVMAAIEDMGFAHSDLSGRCLMMQSPWDAPFVQIFEMIATGPIRQHIEFLNVMLAADEDQAHIQLDVDKRHRGAFGWVLDATRDSTLINFQVPHDAEFGAGELEEILFSAIG